MNSRVNTDPVKLEVERTKCEDEHLFFTRRFFKPRMGFKFTVNWHHAYVAWLIDEVVKGNIANIVINVPPGAGKTELTTNLIARGIGLNPRSRFLYLSFSQSLVEDVSATARNIVKSEDFQSLWSTDISTSTDAKASWKTTVDEGQSKTATSNAQGKFTGDATGAINYATGTGRLVPNKLPQKGTIFTVNYNYGIALEQTKVSSPDADGKLVLNIGSGAAIQPNSVEIVVPVRGSTLAEVTLVDQPINATTGNMVDLFGNIQGTITYASGLVSITPYLDKTIEVTKYTGVQYMSSGVRTA